MKKTLGVFIALAVAMTVKADEVQISSAADLINFMSSWSNSNTYVLTANITLNEDWIPVGTSGDGFNTTFDGQGYTISGLSFTVAVKDNGHVAGLFGIIGADGEVKDLFVDGSQAKANYNDSQDAYVGTLAGINKGKIVGCANLGVKVYGASNNLTVGGLVGKNEGTIMNCYNLGFVDLKKEYTRYILSALVGNNIGTIKNCFVGLSNEASSVIEDEDQNVDPDGPIYGSNSGTVTGCFYLNDEYITYKPGLVTLENEMPNTISAVSGKDVLLKERTIFGDGCWNTICLPFDIPATAEGYPPIAGAEVRELTSASFKNGVLTLNFTEVKGMKVDDKIVGGMEAGKPYLVKTSTTNLTYPVFMGVKVESEVPTEASIYFNESETMGITFKGIYSKIEIEDQDNTILYLGGDNTLYYPNGTMSINSCRAYFKLTGLTAGTPSDDTPESGTGNGTSGGVRTFNLNFGDDSVVQTVIRDAQWSMDNGQCSMDNAWYTLDGRRLATEPTAKGVYIYNGIKRVIK